VSLTNRISYKEEEFGIESNDGLYLDCVLIRPRKTADDQIKTLRVWVPKAPLTKTSTITCARQEVISYGASGTIAHLVFDLRGTGYSDGAADDEQYDIDLASVKAWATERFPQADFGFLGTPHLLHGTVNMVPLRAGVIMENYHFPASVHDAPAVLYMSTFSTFDKLDEARCAALAKAGYEVYGFDPLRYLLHASTTGLLTPDELFMDFDILCQIIGRDVYLIAQPISAGLALLITGMVERIRGVIAIGRANLAFKPKHIFDQNPQVSFDLSGFIKQIAPRPAAFVWLDNHPLGDQKEFSALYQTADDPKRAERAKEISPRLLQTLLQWQSEIVSENHTK